MKLQGMTCENYTPLKISTEIKFNSIYSGVIMYSVDQRSGDETSVRPGFYDSRNEHKIKQTLQYSEEVTIFKLPQLIHRYGPRHVM